jgi:glycosyltransferase involved in cell wall biosynthesis
LTQLTLTPDFSNFLNKLRIRVIGTNQFIYPAKYTAVDKRYCKIERVNPDTYRIRINFAYSDNLLVFLINEKDEKFTITVERFELRPFRNYHAELYIDDKLVLADIGRDGTKNIGTVVTYPKFKPPKLTPQLKEKPKKQKLDILYIISNTMIGGAEKALLRLIQSIDKNIYNIHVLVPNNRFKGRLHNDYERTCNLHYLPNINNWKSQIVSFVNKGDFDIVHLINYQELYSLALQFKASIKVAASIYMEIKKQQTSTWYKTLMADKRIRKRITLWITDCTANKEFLSELEVVPTGIDSNYFKPGKKEPKSIAWVHRISKEKRIDLVLEIARQLPEYKFYLAVAINDIVDPAVLNILKDKPSNVVIHNNLSSAKVAKLLAKSSFFLLTSTTDSMNVATMEAMMSGCVPIITNVGGLPKVIKDGVNGYLIPEDADPSKYIVENIGSFKKSLGAVARKTAMRLWDNRIVTKHHEFLYGRFRQEETRVAFINAYPRLETKFWKMKRDSMQYTIKKLGENFTVLMLAPHKSLYLKKHIINGCNTVFYKYGNLNHIFQVLDEFNPHVIVLNCLHTKIYEQILNRYPKAYKAIYEYGGDLRWILLKRFDRIFVQQEYRKKECIKVNDLNPEKVTVSPFGVDSLLFRPMKANKRWNAVMVSDFRREIKRQHLLIKAWKDVPGRLLLLGRLNENAPYGTYEKECRGLAKLQGISDRIDFMDFIPHQKMPKLLNQCRIGVLTSSREGGSRAQLEIMACGLPMIVMNDCLGTCGFLRENEGLIVEPTPEKIAEGINYLLQHNEKLTMMGKRGSKRVRREMSYNLMHTKFLEAIEEARPEITIITTSLNKGQFINQCIASVDQQRKTNRAKINHLIMDAGSIDETHKILKKWGSKVTVCMKRNISQTTSLNYAMEIINQRFPRTQFIGWINADDWYEPNWLIESLKTMSRTVTGLKPAVTCSAYILRDEKGKTLRGYVDPGAQQVPDSVEINQLTGRNTVNQPSVLIRRTAFEALKKKTGDYWNPTFEFTQDYELWLRMAQAGYLILRIRKPLASLRNYPGQMSHTHSLEQKLEFDKVQELIA